MPDQGDEEAKGDKTVDHIQGQDGKGHGKGQDDVTDAGNPVTDLLSNLGGGLPLPLPF
jgi:hypothetical protein